MAATSVATRGPFALHRVEAGLGVDGEDLGPAPCPHLRCAKQEAAKVHLGERAPDELRELDGEGRAGHLSAAIGDITRLRLPPDAGPPGRGSGRAASPWGCTWSTRPRRDPGCRPPPNRA